MSRAARRGTGRLYGVGLGPGDPELVTLKAYRLLSAAKFVAYPAALTAAGVQEPSLARRIAADFLDDAIVEIPIVLPMRAGDAAPAAAAYDAAAVEIADRLAAGHDVAVLCEGDPLFYGSFIYLLDRLGDRFDVEIVPGVNSFSAAAAALRTPLTSRQAVFAVVPATLSDQEIEARLALADAAAVMKLGRHFSRIRSLLARLGLSDHTRYAERVGQAGERLATLADAPEIAPYFSLLLIHRVDAPQ